MDNRTFVAIRKKPRLESVALDIETPEEKREKLVQEAGYSKRKLELIDEGFEGFEDSDVFEPLPTDRPVFRRLGYIGAYTVNAPNDESKQAAIEILEDDYYILPNLSVTLPEKPTGQFQDIRSTRLRQNTDWPKESGIKLAHENGVRGQGVRVIVLDTGCDSDHIQFQNKTIEFLYVNPTDLDKSRQKRGFDPGVHGTHVCGIIAGENTGVAPDVELVVASVIESERSQTTLARIVFALNWALEHFISEEEVAMPTILNMSLGFHMERLSASTRKGVDRGLKALLRTMLEDFDVLPISAIGNDGAGKIRAPGYFDEALSVGAVDFKLNLAKFSGSGFSPESKIMQPDIMGYGVDVYSALDRDAKNRHWYGTKSGTSMATPYVTGIAALYASADPTLQGTLLRDKLVNTVLPLNLTDTIHAGLARYIE